MFLLEVLLLFSVRARISLFVFCEIEGMEARSETIAGIMRCGVGARERGY